MANRVNVRCETWESDRSFYAAVPEIGSGIVGHSYKGEAEARKLAAGKVVEKALAHERAEQNFRRHMIACADGTVLLVEWRRDAWGWSVWRKDGGGTGGCCYPSGDYREVVDAARANSDAYGGVVWESR